MASDEQTHERGGPLLPKAAYTLCYGLAFGAVYASYMAMGLLPAESIIRHGLHDGAEAARNAWASVREERDLAESEMALPEEPAP